MSRDTTNGITGGAGQWSIRFFDILSSGIAIAILLPFLAAVAAAIRIEDGGPVFFRQERAGLGNGRFRIFKFRSMAAGAENIGTGLFIDGENDSRITRVGRFLRRTSIDELPQLLNIFRGEMSVVGPRPGMPSHVLDYSERQMRRLDVRPGLTGWAQINGRNSLSWPERIEMDLWYIEHRSLWMNILIILKTIPALIRSGGLYAGREKFVIAEMEDGTSPAGGSPMNDQNPRTDETIPLVAEAEDQNLISNPLS